MGSIGSLIAIGAPIAGAATGGSIGAAIGSAVGGLAGGLANQATFDRNADLSTYYSQVNAERVAGAARATEGMIGFSSIFNAMGQLAQGAANANMIEALSGYNATIIGQVSEYNAGVVQSIAEYNSLLLEDEAKMIWDSAELDVMMINRDYDQVKGQAINAYGASGVQVNATDTPAKALASMEAQRLLDVFAVRHSADTQAKKVLDKAAQERWLGKVEAGTIIYEGSTQIASTLYEGKLRARSTRIGAAIGAMTTMAQGAININQSKIQTGLDVDAIRFGGATSAYEARQRGDIALLEGLYKGGTTAARMFDRYYTPSDTKADKTPAYNPSAAETMRTVGGYNPNLSLLQ